MSGTHSTLADRTPSILNKDQPSDKKPKNEKSPISLKHEFDPTGMVQRCVIIQRDENGFGLTVSGDNPVFVQLVKEDGAAMRAGVQTGDRIIKVNGTLVTHSNHIEVVKLIKSGSYVALTVLGRPPGHSQFPLGEEEEELASEEEEEEEGRKEEEEEEEKEEEMVVQEGEEREEVGGGVLSSSHSSSPAQPRAAPTGHSPEQYHAGSPTPLQNNVLPGQSEVADEEAMLTPRELKCSPPLDGSSDQLCHPVVSHSVPGNPLLLSPSQSETSCHGLKTNLDDVTNLCPLPDPDDPSYHMMNQSQAPASCERERVSFAPMVATGHHDRIQTAENPSTQCIIGTSPSPPNPPIIGAEDDYFDTQQEQMNGQCSCFQSMELLKSRPAHLAAFLHHVVSQFDPAPLLCYLYADLHRHTSSKESRRVFMDFHSLFLDRVANLKVPVPESVSAELERKRLELIPEDLCKRYTQQLQETLLPDILKNLEDFRQKRSMGLTLAEDQLTRLELDRERGKLSTEKESTCAEHIISKIEDILMTPHPAEEEKCATMQYVMLTYMKHLGVKVKEARSLEPKRVRINFLPKIKTRIKPEKEGEEKVKRPRFPSILGQPRRPSRVEPASISKAMELTKQRSPKQQAQHPISSVPDHPDPSLPSRTRCSQSSDGSDAGSHALPHAASPPPHITSANYTSDNSGQESDSGLTPSSPHQSERGCHSAEHQECVPSPAATMHFDFSPSTLEHLPEEEHSAASLMDSSGGAGTPAEVHSEDDQAPGCGVFDGQEDPLNWQRLVSREVLAGLTPLEVKRQEVINELLYTEQAHLRMLKVLDSVFYQRLSRDSILPPDDIRHIFANLEEVIQLHVSITEQMATIRKRSESSVIGHIGEDLLAWFGGEEEENMKQAVGSFCSNQPLALEIIKTRQKKEQRFISFIQEAESNRLCRRLQLKDIIPIEMQRLTKYPLLLERLAKYTENTEERDKVKKAGDCCRNVLSHVNQAVKEAENKQRLVDYQRRLDLSSLKQSENPMVLEFKNLDLTKGKMVHEGPLYWKVNKDKTIELYTVLLEEVLVLLQKQDERLVLKCHSKNLAGTADTKHIFSPIIKLNNVLVRPVATDNKSFFVISMSDSGAQIYELTAQTVSEQRTWQCLITQCAETMKARGRSVVPHVQTSTEQATLEIMNSGLTKASREPLCTLTGRIQSADKEDKENTSSSLVLHTPPTISTNPFEGTDSDEDEYVESAPADRADEEEVEEEEVDVDELEAFLDGELADRLPLLQERSRQGIAIDSQEHLTLNLPCSRAAEALKTLATLKQLLLDHMVSREEKKADIDDEPALRSNSVGNFSWARRAPSAVSADSNAAEGNAEKAEPELQPRHLGLFETPESNGSEESYTDDGWGEAHRQASSGDMVGLTSGIDLTKLLSSSSQTGGDGNDSGPNLSRQLMTHLRLLQANLQHLKEVEERYNQLCHTGTEMATDSEECNGQMSRMSEER